MAELFDKPTWDVKLIRNGDASVSVPLEFYDEENTKLGRVMVYPPSGLVAWLAEVPKVESLFEVVIYLDKVGKRWVLGVSTSTTEYDLWHYTDSTLPYWARKVIG